MNERISLIGEPVVKSRVCVSDILCLTFCDLHNILYPRLCNVNSLLGKGGEKMPDPGQKRGRVEARPLKNAKMNYFRLPSQVTLTLVTAGSAEMSLETTMVPSNMPFTRAA